MSVSQPSASELEKALQAMREERDMLLAHVDIAEKLLLTLDASGSILMINRAGSERLGYAPDELKGKNWFKTCVPRRLQSGLLADLKRLLGGGANPDELVDSPVLTKAGEEIMFAWEHKTRTQKDGARCLLCIGEDLEARRTTEIALRESESRYRGIFEDSPISLWEEDFSEIRAFISSLQAEGVDDLRSYFENHPEAVRHCASLVRVVDVNRATVDLLEADNKERLLGYLNEIFRPESYELLKEELIALVEGRKIFETETVNRTLTGKEIYVNLRMTVAPNFEDTWSKVFVSLSDSTERKLAEQALRESEERYRGVVESSPEAIFVEQEGAVVFVNPAGLRMLAADSVNQVAEQSMQNLMQQESSRRWAQTARKQGDAAIPIAAEGKMQRLDGELLTVEVKSIDITYQGEPARLYLVRDVTEARVWQQTAQRMERLAAIGQMATTIAHEIRNPLGSIALNLQYLSARLQDRELFEKKFRNIDEGMGRIQAIVKGILDFARPMPPALQQLDIHKVLESGLRSVQADLVSSGITVKKEFAEELPDVVVDPNQLVQVFVNLFLNARDAMKPGGTLSIETALTQSGVRVSVSDTGKGIPQEDRESIFNPFFTTKNEGIGLGLSVVSRILESHQASIRVDALPDRGTKFAIQFPTHILS